jgi:tetratricopeptide (TPR) repeat protein
MSRGRRAALVLGRTMKLLPVSILLLLFLSPASFGQALSKQDLIDLKKAGVDKAVLIQQIQKDGINFEMSAATTIELKNLGFPDDVLSALLSSKTSVEHTPAAQDSVTALYKAGRFPELADHLKTALKSNPSDYRSEALLIMTLLKMKEKDSANAEFQHLAAHERDPAAAPYVKQVKNLVDTLDRIAEGKSKFLTALKDFNVQEASRAIEQLGASPLQRELLKVILDSYRGDFDSAHTRLSKLNPDSFAAKQQLSNIDARLKQTQDEYTKALARVDVYIHSPYAPSSCFPPTDTPKHLDFYKLNITEYLNSVSSLVRLAPVNDLALDLFFHAEMLVGEYTEVEQLGDRILRAKGAIHIPFFSRDKYFDVIIDAKKGRIYSVTSPDPFAVQYPMNGSGWSPAGRHQGLANHNDWNAVFVPFDLSFAEITSVSQHVPWGHTTADYIKGQPYALKFSPTGQAPNYAVMLLLGCTAGYEAQMRATRNLGQYVVHVIGKKDLHVELVDPSKKPSNYGWMFGAMTAFYSGLASQTGNTALADANANLQQMLSTEQSKGEVTRQYQLQTASELLDEQTAFLSDDLFVQLESLLDLL